MFSGSGFATVYGTISPKGAGVPAPVSIYSLDDGSPATFTASQESTTLYSQIFYESPPLQDGSHTLVITSTVENSFFWLDFITVTPVANSSSVTQEGSSSSTLATGSPSDVTSPVSSTAQIISSTTASQSAPSSVVATTGISSNRSAVIAGAVLGILGILLLAALLALFFRRRGLRRKRSVLPEKYEEITRSRNISRKFLRDTRRTHES